jgi:phosphoglycerate dehydrogenase-like enzyme
MLWIKTAQGGRNASIDIAAANERGVTVCGTGGMPWSTAELTWALILALAKKVTVEDAAIREGRFMTTLGLDLDGKTLGLLGLGKLGARVATIGLAFGMNVIAWCVRTRERERERETFFVCTAVVYFERRLTRGCIGLCV